MHGLFSWFFHHSDWLKKQVYRTLWDPHFFWIPKTYFSDRKNVFLKNFKIWKFQARFSSSSVYGHSEEGMLHILGPQISSSVKMLPIFFTYQIWSSGTHFWCTINKYNFLRSEIKIFWFFDFFTISEMVFHRGVGKNTAKFGLYTQNVHTGAKIAPKSQKKVKK